jgi:hypothetical protein
MSVSSKTHVSLPIEKELIERYLKPEKQETGKALYEIINRIVREHYEEYYRNKEGK